MKRFLWFGLGVICIVALAAAGTPGFKHPCEFTLVASGADPTPVSFRLAPRWPEPMAYGGKATASSIEDNGPPFNTALGWNALFNNIFDTTGGQQNVACGYMSMYTNTIGSYKPAIGYTS